MMEFLVNLIEASIIVSVFAVILLIIRPIINKIFGPKIMSLIWILLLIKLIYPYGPESTLSIYNIFNQMSSPLTYDNNTSINQPNLEVANIQKDEEINSKNNTNININKKYEEQSQL